MEELERQFTQELLNLCPQGLLVAAVSGGGDSVAMLHLLARSGRRVVVAHLDHLLRERSGEDARFVCELADRLGMECELRQINVAEVAKEKRGNIEAVARELRYAFLTEVARKYKAKCILTAHTLEDNAETVMLQIFRGAARALGIRKQRGKVIRPLLGIKRSELRMYLKELGEEWLEDPSNELTCYDRNYLRHEVWPRVIARFPRAGEAVRRYSENQQDDDKALDVLAQARLVRDSRFEPVLSLRARPLLEAPRAIRRRALRQIILEQGLRPENRYVELAEKSLLGESVSLGQFVLRPVEGGVVWIPSKIDLLRVAKAPEGLVARRARPGDRVRLGQISKRLVDFLAEKNIPPELRREWPVAERRGEVVWVWRLLPEEEDYKWMRQAMKMARLAARENEVPVGAIIIKNDQLIGAAANEVEKRKDATAHAEMLAIRAAQKKLDEKVLPRATVYVSLEPCPMCMGALVEAGVERVVWATENPKAGAVTRYGMQLPFKIEAGLLARESAMLLKGFFANLREPKT